MYPKMYLYKRISDAKILIDRNYMCNINLDQIAKQVYLSKYHFLRLFKEAYHVTPHQYLINKKIEAAKIMLMDGLSLYEICDKLGYKSLSSFCHLFKKHTSMSPRKFSKYNRE